MAVIAFDKSKKEVRRWERTGAKYIYRLQLAEDFKTLTFYGLQNQSFAIDLADLQKLTWVLLRDAFVILTEIERLLEPGL